MTSKPTRSDIFDVNPKTGALILGKNRLEDYAEKYLKQHCPEALTTPMPLPVDQILTDAKLHVQEVSLSRNSDIFGCCLLLDGEVEIFDETGKSKTVKFPAGTVLIDPASEALYGEGAKRNTLMHEALHWEKDKMYFEILALQNAAASEKLYPIMCRQSQYFFEPSEGKKTKANEVRWLEWQAHRLAPRVLMPFHSFKAKALEFIKGYESMAAEVLPSCDVLIEDLSEFFIVSRSSVKYRLLEVGLRDQISKLGDYGAIYAGIDDRREFVPLTAADAYEMLCSDFPLLKWIQSGSFLFVDGYFVLANEKYITLKNGCLHLTTKAKKNLAQCAINIVEQKYTSYKYIQEDLAGCSFLYKKETEVDPRLLLLFHPQNQTGIRNIDVKNPEDAYVAFGQALSNYDENEERELATMLGNPNNTLCQCLIFLMKNRHWNAPAIFKENTCLHENYYGKIKNDAANNMDTSTLMAICVGLRLTLHVVQMIFDKSKNKLSYYDDPDKTYIRILETMPFLSIQDFNSVLSQQNLKELGTSTRAS